MLKFIQSDHIWTHDQFNELIKAFHQSNQKKNRKLM
jgi:hypothetical protein